MTSITNKDILKREYLQIHVALIDISKIKFLTQNAVRHSVTEQFVLVSPFDVTVEEATGNHCLPGKR